MRFDLALVVARSGSPEDKRTARLYRRPAYKRMITAGLQLIARTAPDGEHAFVLVGATEERLLVEAERQKLRKRVRTLADRRADPMTAHIVPRSLERERGACEPFSASEHYAFARGPQGLFTSLERQRLLAGIIETSEREGGAGVDLDGSVADGVFVGVIALVDNDEVPALEGAWLCTRAAPCSTLPPAVPVHAVRDYFGEKYALYFEYQRLYTVFLAWLSVAALLATAVQITLALVPADGTFHLEAALGSPLFGPYCLVLAAWGTLLGEMWKRRQSELAFLWGTTDFEEEEPSTARFVRSAGVGLARGQYTPSGQFVSLADLDSAEYVPHFAESEQRRRALASAASVILLMGFIVAVTLAIAAIKIILQRTCCTEWGAVYGAILNSAFIAMMGYIWEPFARWVNDLEMHRTRTAYEDHLILKTFAFQFVNNYASLYYIALVQGTRAPLLGLRHGGELVRDECPRGDDGEPSCMRAFFIQLVTLVLMRQVWRQVLVFARYAILPRASAALRRRRTAEAAAVADGADTDEVTRHCAQQLELPEHGGTAEEYAEMIIQFGYVSLFSSVFPFAACLCLATNVLEMQTDARKLLRLCRRPRYLGAEDIGVFMPILSFLSYASVVTNALLAYLLSETVVTDIFPHVSGARRLAIIVGAEHVMLGLKLVLAHLVPDAPRWVVHAQARRAYALQLREERASAGAYAQMRASQAEADFATGAAMGPGGSAKHAQARGGAEDLETEFDDDSPEAWRHFLEDPFDGLTPLDEDEAAGLLRDEWLSGTPPLAQQDEAVPTHVASSAVRERRRLVALHAHAGFADGEDARGPRRRGARPGQWAGGMSGGGGPPFDDFLYDDEDYFRRHDDVDAADDADAHSAVEPSACGNSGLAAAVAGISPAEDGDDDDDHDLRRRRHQPVGVEAGGYDSAAAINPARNVRLDATRQLRV